MLEIIFDVEFKLHGTLFIYYLCRSGWKKHHCNNDAHLTLLILMGGVKELYFLKYNLLHHMMI